jgi:phosphatidylethanolamine/phosphatidyl-N-methylethanolamine N-methyltransferase
MAFNQSDYYENYYRRIHYKGFLRNFTSGYHKKLEGPYKPAQMFSNVLEIGGGAGEHLVFVRHQFENYVLLDITKNDETLVQLQKDVRMSRIQFLLADASEIPSPDNHYDRILATCVLHHIPRLENALNELRRVAKDGALLDLYIPCDPGLMYRWIRHWTSHLKQKKIMNISWRQVKYLWAIEHRNHYLGIFIMCKKIFENDKVKVHRYPFAFASWNFNLYSVIRIQIQKD